jgi:prohibitin 2
VLAACVVILPRSFRFIHTGDGGVFWSRFFGGTVIQPAMGEGVHVILPWDHIEVFDLKLREMHEDYAALANDGLPVTATVSLRYRVNPARLANLYQDIGPGYESTLIAPQIGTIVREVLSRYPADELYAYARARLENEILETISDKLDFVDVVGAKHKHQDERNGYVFVQGIAVLDVKLPPTVTNAIEQKMAQDQSAQQYEFKVKAEQLETERRAIEVDGIRNYAVVAEAPWFRDYLRYIEIQANYDMAKSTNAKLIFLGNSAEPTGNPSGGAAAPAARRTPPITLNVPTP